MVVASGANWLAAPFHAGDRPRAISLDGGHPLAGRVKRQFASRGHCLSADMDIPALAVATSSAASVGSPRTRQAPARSPGLSRASQQRAAMRGLRWARPVHRLTALPPASLPAITHPCQAIPLPAGPDLADGHLVLCERAGLVSQDHGRRSQRLDFLQTADQRLACGHPPGAHRQR